MNINLDISSSIRKRFFQLILCLSSIAIKTQSYLPSDPQDLIYLEKLQFENKLPISSSFFRPLFFKKDSSQFHSYLLNEFYLNDNSPNQENMDVRYFSKGAGFYSSFRFGYNSPYITFLIEPYLINSNDYKTNDIGRSESFSVLNDQTISRSKPLGNKNIRNLLIFLHYKGIGFGRHDGNKWWGPGIHSTFQMTNNTFPIPSQVIGTIREIRFNKIGLFAQYHFSKLNNLNNKYATYLTSLNSQISWHGSSIISLGFSRNYLTGGDNLSNYNWTEKDAKKIVFESLFINNLLENEYTVGGHDLWDQTLSGYVSIIFPKRNIKLYSELGFNDNRMYFADFLSQPDHSMATIFGIRDYGFGKWKKFVWGFEWTNLMITYTSRHRPGGEGTWYTKQQYNYSSINNRRWGAHSGSDSDDWYLYGGFINDNYIVIQSINYERHGIVTYRPAEIKLEYSIDARYKYRDFWFRLFYERQFEAFLGFPDYFYEDKYSNELDDPSGKIAKSRITNTLIFSISKYFSL